MMDLVMHYRSPRQTRCLAILAAVLILLAWASPSIAQTVADLRPIVITVSGTRGQRIDRLEVLATHGGRLEPIPFQVDSVVDGSFVLPSGPYPSTESPNVL